MGFGLAKEMVDGRGQPVADRDASPLRFEADGTVRLVGETLGGQLSCRGGRFRNKDGVALNLFEAKVTGGAFLDLVVDGRGQPVAGRDANRCASRPTARSACPARASPGS